MDLDLGFKTGQVRPERNQRLVWTPYSEFEKV